MFTNKVFENYSLALKQVKTKKFIGMGCQNSVDLVKMFVNIWNIVESYICTYLQVCKFQPVNQYELYG